MTKLLSTLIVSGLMLLSGQYTASTRNGEYYWQPTAAAIVATGGSASGGNTYGNITLALKH